MRKTAGSMSRSKRSASTAFALTPHLPLAVRVGYESLFEPVTSFGKPYWAVPDEDEFSCEYEPRVSPADGTLVAAGSDAFAGEHLQVDVEGLAIYATGKNTGYLVASSQGDNTFHVVRPPRRQRAPRHVRGCEHRRQRRCGDYQRAAR